MGLTFLGGCASAYVKQVGGDISKAVTRTFVVEYPLAWESVQDALKSEKIDSADKGTGSIQTLWDDNTQAMNTLDAVQGHAVYVKSKYRFKIKLNKTFHQGVPAVQVSIRKDQLIQQDVLEDLRVVESDGTDENTLLYRVGRLIYMKNKVQELDKQREEQEKKAAEEQAPSVSEEPKPQT